MPRITVVRPFRHAEDGITAREFNAGDQDVSETVAAVALRNGWAVEDARQPTKDDAEDQGEKPRRGRGRKAST